MSVRARVLLGRIVVVAGAATACGSSSSGGAATTSGEAGGASGAGGGGGAAGGSASGAAGASGASGATSAGGGGGAAGMSPVPPAAYPVCDGDAGPATGCCRYLECYAPKDGKPCAPAPTSGFGSDASGTASICVGSPGSGLCTCGAVEGPFAGPYGTASAFAEPPNAASCTSGVVGTIVSPYQDGACCYVVPLSSSCPVPGRPMILDGGPCVASLVRRRGWT